MLGHAAFNEVVEFRLIFVFIQIINGWLLPILMNAILVLVPDLLLENLHVPLAVLLRLIRSIGFAELDLYIVRVPLVLGHSARAVTYMVEDELLHSDVVLEFEQLRIQPCHLFISHLGGSLRHMGDLSSYGGVVFRLILNCWVSHG